MKTELNLPILNEKNMENTCSVDECADGICDTHACERPTEITFSTRRTFLSHIARLGAAACILSAGVSALTRYPVVTSGSAGDKMVWQIDPRKCVACDRCASHCVLNVSAVRCFQNYDMCGYCKQCFAFFQPDFLALTSSAENQLCPTDAIKRKFIQDPYHEYIIDQELCVGCGKCVDGCIRFGNGSLYLQVDQSRCLGCNECRIALDCPAQAFIRVPESKAYIMRTASH